MKNLMNDKMRKISTARVSQGTSRQGGSFFNFSKSRGGNLKKYFLCRIHGK
jgi:hypothetical protein